VPFPNCRVVDSEGRYYVVVERVGGPKFEGPYGPVSLRIAERRLGSTRVAAATARVTIAGGYYIMSGNSDVIIRDGDIVHGEVLLPEPPSTIFVLSKGMGVILLDLYGFNAAVASRQGSSAVTIFSAKGELRCHFKLGELFGESVLPDFKRADGLVYWLDYAWIDESRKLLVIVSQKTSKGIRHFRKIDLTTFRISSVEIYDVLSIISTQSSPFLGNALDLLAEFDYVAARVSLVNIVENEELPLMNRLKAGVLLAPLGDHRVRRLIRAALLAPQDAGGGIQNRGAIKFAVEHSVEILGVDALPLLDRVIQRSGNFISLHQISGNFISVHSFCSAYRRLGSKSVPALCKLVEDGRPGVESIAAEILGCLGPDAEMAIPCLVRALRRKTTDGTGRRTDEAAVVALGRIGSKAKVAIPDLLDLLRNGDEELRRPVLETLKLLGGIEENEH
jgi:hypothetical protein